MVGRIDNWKALGRKLSFLLNELDIFIYHEFMYVSYLFLNVGFVDSL